MRGRLIDFVDKLNQHDPSVCGDVPTQIVDGVADRFSNLIKDNVGDEELQARVEALAIGAVRYVADQCGVEAETLIATLDSLVEK